MSSIITCNQRSNVYDEFIAIWEGGVFTENIDVFIENVDVFIENISVSTDYLFKLKLLL